MRPAVLAAALALLVPPAAAAAQATISADVERSIRAQVDQGITVGVVVAVVDAAGTRYFRYGSTAQGGSPVDEHTVFEIGSITKVFTALALADMALTGRVGLDDPVTRYLPTGSRVPSREGLDVTLRLLSAQRSGLPRMPGNFRPADPQNPYADYGADSLLAFLARYELTRDPGERYEYSNLGVGLLGYALSRREGTTYEELVTRRVLRPLGMRATMITLTADARDRLAVGHAGSRPAANWDFDAIAGAGALRSTAADIARFLAAAMGLVRTPLDSAFGLTLAVQGAASPVMDVGLGWHIIKRPTLRIVWHNGGTGGYRSWAGFDPVRRVGAVVLTNSTTSFDALGMRLLDSTVALPEVRASLTSPAESLAAYVGRYELAPAFVITVTREGDRLFGQATAQPAFRLWASARDSFFLREVAAEVAFERDANGRVAALVLHQNGRATRGARRED